MISTFMGLETAKRGLSTSQGALYTTGNNVANANTLGYSRQRVNLVQTSGFPTVGLNSPREEQQLGRAVLLLNQQVDHLLKLQKQEIQRDIQEINKKKKSSNKYTNPYESLSVDGVFYDKRN